MSLSFVRVACREHNNSDPDAIANGCVPLPASSRSVPVRRRRRLLLPCRSALVVLLEMWLAGVLAVGAGAVPPSRQNVAANVSGKVADETGAAITQADISIVNPSTGLQRVAITDDRGYFLVPLLPVGTYALSAHMAGFGTVTIKDIQVHAGIDVSLTIRLKPKEVTETIDVVANGDTSGRGSRVSGLDTSDAATKYSVTNREVMSLPVFANELGRNTLQSLPFLVPGVTPNTTLGALSGLNVAGIAVRGSRSSSVSFNIEGGDDNDDEYNQALAALPNPDALEEFTFTTSNYQADLGRSAGGVINAAVKSGTNHLRGNVRYLGINDALNARGFFDPRTPRFRLNNFGGQLGGPAVLPFMPGLANRLSFFVDYEGTRSRRESNSTFVVPSVAQRNGDFSALPLSQQPYDPFTGLTRGTQRHFPGGLIPHDRFDPIAQSYLKQFIPLPNSGDHNFTELLPTSFANDQAASRLDLKATERDNVNLIFLAASSRIEDPTGYLPANAQFLEDAGSRNLVLRHTRVLGSAAINEITAAVTRYDSSVQILAPGGTGRDPKDIGFNGIHPQTDVRLAVPTIYFYSAASTIYAGYGYSSTKTSVQVKDGFSFRSGRHALKFGAETRWYNQQRSYVPPSIDGQFSFYWFNPLGTGNDFADFLIGRPYYYYQSTDSSSYPRQSAYQFYGMDDLHITSDLTINVGLRYALTPPAVHRLKQVSAFRPGQQSTVFPAAPAGLIFVGDDDPVLGRLPRGLYRTDFRDLAPRLGLAFVPSHAPGPMRHLFGEGKTAIRSGWGMFY